MKKLIMLMLCTLMLVGCTGKTGAVDNSNKKPEIKEQELPTEELLGYWNNYDDGEFFGFDMNYDGSVKSILLGNWNRGNIDEGKIKSCSGKDNVFEITIEYSDGKYRDIVLDLSKLSERIVKVGDREYEYAAIETVQAEMAFEYMSAEKVFNRIKGYWNNPYGGEFLMVDDNENGEHCFMAGYYDAGVPAVGTILYATESAGYTYLGVLLPGLGYGPYPTQDEIAVYELDLTHLEANIIEFRELKYVYAGADADTAYNEYAARLYK